MHRANRIRPTSLFWAGTGWTYAQWTHLCRYGMGTRYTDECDSGWTALLLPLALEFRLPLLSAAMLVELPVGEERTLAVSSAAADEADEDEDDANNGESSRSSAALSSIDVGRGTYSSFLWERCRRRASRTAALPPTWDDGGGGVMGDTGTAVDDMALVWPADAAAAEAGDKPRRCPRATDCGSRALGLLTPTHG